MAETMRQALKWDKDRDAAVAAGMSYHAAAQHAWSIQNGRQLTMADPGTSKCPHCLKVYYTHSRSKGTASELEKHMKRRCK